MRTAAKSSNANPSLSVVFYTGASGHCPRSADIFVRFGCGLNTFVLL